MNTNQPPQRIGAFLAIAYLAVAGMYGSWYGRELLAWQHVMVILLTPVFVAACLMLAQGRVGRPLRITVPLHLILFPLAAALAVGIPALLVAILIGDVTARVESRLARSLGSGMVLLLTGGLVAWAYRPQGRRNPGAAPNREQDFRDEQP